MRNVAAAACSSPWWIIGLCDGNSTTTRRCQRWECERRRRRCTQPNDAAAAATTKHRRRRQLKSMADGNIRKDRNEELYHGHDEWEWAVERAPASFHAIGKSKKKKRSIWRKLIAEGGCKQPRPKASQQQMLPVFQMPPTNRFCTREPISTRNPAQCGSVAGETTSCHFSDFINSLKWRMNLGFSLSFSCHIRTTLLYKLTYYLWFSLQWRPKAGSYISLNSRSQRSYLQQWSCLHLSLPVLALSSWLMLVGTMPVCLPKS